MGVTLPKNMRFASFNVSAIKGGLQSIDKTGSPLAFLHLKSVGTGYRDRAMLFEELLDRKLIERGEDFYYLTEAGKAVATGNGRARTPIARAQTEIESFLARIEAYNADPEAFLYVDQVWVFGSVMRGEATVGDIDMAISTSRRPVDEGNWEQMRQRVREAVRKHEDRPRRRSSLFFSGEDWLMNRAIFGRRRHPLLSGVQDGTRDLETLGAPCQLLFDRMRGGRVNDPVLPRHPASEGRRDNAPEPQQLSDLTPDPLRPMDAHWIGGYDVLTVVSAYSIFGSWEDAKRLYVERPRKMRLLFDEDLAHWPGWRPHALESGVLDGRDRVLLLKDGDEGSAGTSVVLNRTIVEDETGVRVMARFESPELINTVHPAQELYEDHGKIAAILVAADAQRVLRRQMDSGSTKGVSIVIDCSGIEDDLRCMIASDMAFALEERLVSIEPAEWSGPTAEIRRMNMDWYVCSSSEMSPGP